MKQRATYGIDGPGVVRAHIVLGLLLTAIAAIGFGWSRPHRLPAAVSIGAACAAFLLLVVAAVMLWASLVGKKRVRDRLVAALALSGDRAGARRRLRPGIGADRLRQETHVRHGRRR